MFLPCVLPLLLPLDLEEKADMLGGCEDSDAVFQEGGSIVGRIQDFEDFRFEIKIGASFYLFDEFFTGLAILDEDQKCPLPEGHPPRRVSLHDREGGLVSEA
jgi:hypothetical protein